jgi:hypothetical protein
VYTPVRVARVVDKLDLLFMIDNSPSMLPKQSALKAALPRLATVLENFAATRPISYHIGVITSDLGASGSTVSNCRRPPDGGVLGGDGARLQPLGAAHAASCGTLQGASNFIDLNQIAQTNNLPTNGQGLATTIQCMVSVGEQGCGFEMSLESVYRALHDPIPENAGFLRPDALLAVLYLTDEDDCSAPAVTNLFEGTATQFGQLSGYRCAAYGVQCGQPPMLPPRDTTSDGGLLGCEGATAAVGGQLLEVSRYIDYFGNSLVEGGLKANPAEVLMAAIFAPVEPFEIIGKSLFNQQPCSPISGQCQPAVAASCELDGGLPDASFIPYAGEPPVRLNQVLNALPQHRAHAEICNLDYAGPVDSLGQLITSQFGAVCLPAPLNVPNLPDCLVEDVTVNAGGLQVNELPACSAGAGFPCWKLVADNACPGVLNALGQTEKWSLVVDRNGAPTPGETIPRGRCAMQLP